MSLLTARDSAILSSLFSSEPPAPPAPPSDYAPTASAPAPAPQGLPNFSPSLLHQIQTTESAALRPLNTASPSPDTIDAAIDALTSLITAHPNYPSAYNNRAQALRLLHGSDLTVSAAAESAILDDLESAIRICDPPATALQADILAKAYTQRGAALLLTSTTLRKREGEGGAEKKSAWVLEGKLRGKDAEEVEEMARGDFREGKRWGSVVAGEMDVKMNPVRKMCGEIVREAMVRDLRESGVLPECA